MKGDFSRSTFRPEAQYSRVLMQQGRVQLDADWNEQMAILARRDEIQTADFIGPCGAPADSAGFHFYLRPALDFRPAGPYIQIDDGKAFDFAGDDSFTLEAWVCPREGGPVAANTSAAVHGGYALLLLPDLTVRFERDYREHTHEDHHAGSHQERKRERFQLTTKRHLPKDRYSHIAVVCEGRSTSIYISGELSETGVCPHPPAISLEALWIGARRAPDSTPVPVFGGEIADLRIWDTARTAADLREHARHMKPGRHPHLMGWYRFDADSDRITDESGHPHHGAFASGTGAKEAKQARADWKHRLWVQRGRYYVDGILCENFADAQVSLPPAAPKNCPDPAVSAAPPEGRRLLLAWLDVWEDLVNALEDSHIREEALGGADTTARARVFWKVRWLELEESDLKFAADGNFPSSRTLLDSRRGRPVMQAKAGSHNGVIENNLYRVEINRSGAAPTFVWSRDNGSVILPVIGLVGTNSVRIGITASGELRLEHGSWLELCTEDSHFSDDAPVLLRVKSVDHLSRVIEFESSPQFPAGHHRYVRVWNHKGDSPGIEIETQEWIKLERGIEVRFPSQDTYRTGDYWLIPSRSASGSIHWPERDGDTLALPAFGSNRRSCRLALVEDRAGHLQILRPYWRTFLPLTRVAADEGLFVRKAGDEMTGSLGIDGSLTVQQNLTVTAVIKAAQVSATQLDADQVRAGLFTGNLDADQVKAGLFTGNLDVDMVGTPQLLDEGVTTEKLAQHSVTLDKLAFALPEASIGFSLMSSSPHPVPGYVCVNHLLAHNPSPPWKQPRFVRRQAGGQETLRAVSCGDRIFVISEYTGAMWALDPLSGAYEERTPLPVSRRAFALAELHGHIYLIGGYDLTGGAEEVTGDVFVYHPALDEWTETARLRHPRAHLAAACAGGKIFAFGGERPAFLRTKRTAVCEFLDVAGSERSGETLKWDECGDMIQPRSRFALASHNGCLFAVGGSRSVWGGFGSQVVGLVEKFYPELVGGRDWSCLLRPLPEPRSETGAAVLDGRLFCGGGRLDGTMGLYSIRFTRACQMLDLRLNQWTPAPPMPLARSGASLVTLRNTVFAVGGRGPEIDIAPVLPLASCYYAFEPVRRPPEHPTSSFSYPNPLS